MFIVEMYGVPSDPANKRFFDCGHRVWESALALGKQYGWKPMGTIPEPSCMEMFVKSGHYNHDYEPIMWGAEKMVLADDAKAWAEALERAVADSDEKALAEASKPGVPIVSDWMKSEEDFQFVNGGPSRKKLLEFAEFMKNGGFGFTWDD
jgi:hypothetical protein